MSQSEAKDPIFVEAVASRCGISIERARKFIAPISDDLIDRWWPLKEVVAQFEKGDLCAVYYGPKKSR